MSYASQAKRAHERKLWAVRRGPQISPVYENLNQQYADTMTALAQKVVKTQPNPKEK